MRARLFWMTVRRDQPLPPAWRVRLHEVIFEADTAAGRAFDVLLDPKTSKIIEPEHPGWNSVRFNMIRTPEQPAYCSALTGLPACTRAFSDLDPIGRPDPEGPVGGHVLRGYALSLGD